MRRLLKGVGYLVALILVAILILALLMTRSTVTVEKKLRIDEQLVLSYRITSEGGALGDERYEIFAEHEGRRNKVFEGTNGKKFLIQKSGPDLIHIRFCDGRIDHVSEIWFEGRGRPNIIVQPDIYCGIMR